MVGQWLLIGVMTIALLLLYVGYVRVHNCLDNYIQQNNQAQQVRSRAAEEERSSMVRVFDAIVNKPADVRSVIAAHLSLLKKNDELREANPYPEPPSHC